MGWKESLRDRAYVANNLMPGVIRAAVKDESSQAMFLLASVLLMYSVEGKSKVHPLKTIYNPAEALYEAFPGTREIWEESGDAALLSQVPEMFLGRKREILRDVIEQIKAQKSCECSLHATPVISQHGRATGSCIIPSVFLWDTLLHLLGTCSNGIAHDLIGSFIFSIDHQLRQHLEKISSTKVEAPQALVEEFSRNNHELTQNAETAPTQRPDIWILTDYVDHVRGDLVETQYATYFLKIGRDKSSNQAIEVHHHIRKDVAQNLDNVSGLLVADGKSLAGYNWWPKERPQAKETRIQDWSRYRAVFFFTLAKQIIENTALIQTDNAPSPLLGSKDIETAESAMKKCWTDANEEGDISEEWVDWLTKDARDLSKIEDAGTLSSEIKTRIVESEGYPALEKRVMQCVCELIDMETEQSPSYVVGVGPSVRGR